MKAIIYILLLFSVSICACSDSGSTEAKDQSPQDTNEELKEDEAYPNPVVVYENIVRINSAERMSNDFKGVEYLFGSEDVWIEKDKVVLDSGKYTLINDTLTMHMVTQNHPIIYLWKDKGDKAIELHQLGTEQILYAELSEY